MCSARCIGGCRLPLNASEAAKEGSHASEEHGKFAAPHRTAAAASQEAGPSAAGHGSRKPALSSPTTGRSYYVGRRAIGLGLRSEDPQTAWELHGSADTLDRYIPNPEVEACMEFAPMESTLPSSDNPVGIARGGIVTHAVVACRQGANQRVIRCSVKASPELASNVRNRVRASRAMLLTCTLSCASVASWLCACVCARALHHTYFRLRASAENNLALEFGNGGRGQMVPGCR